MAADKPRPTSADYVAVGLGPALIVGLITSLVYFLVAVLYDGDFVGRLQWGLFWLVVGLVFVVRLSMATESAERAPLYGALLAVLGWFSLGRFVEFPPGLAAMSWLVNAGLVALIWWSAYKLVWDSTYVDETAEADASGVLGAAGLGASTETPQEASPKKKKRLGWWERYKKYQEQRRKNHTPGVWVVYFSLAAFPIFGLGQALIDPEDGERRRHVFWLMACYATSALGLLVVTAFLTLRRYLRQRGVQMPKPVTTFWLGSGAALTVALVVVGAVLPRPNAEFSLLSLTKLGSKERDASRFAPLDGDPGKGDGRAGEQQLDEKQGTPVDAGKKDAKGSGGKGQAKGSGQGEKKGDKGGSSKDKSGKGEKGKGEETKGDDKDDKGGDKDDKGGDGGSDKARDAKAGKTSGKGSARKASSSTWNPPPVVEKTLRVLKWLVFVALAVAVLVFLLRGGLRYLANFFDWAKDLLAAFRAFWARLFGGRPAMADVGDTTEFKEERRPRRPFRFYTNPFDDGRAETQSPAEVVRYSFEALEAWMQERDAGRRDDETPLEFASRIGDEAPGLEAEAKRLAALYARVLYAPGGVPANWRATLESFWRKIEAAASQPLSA